eukprot:m.323509 g.323509  ORF g.323509 m.323509 type:complete len:164 (-) comp55528_c0_seq4:89-580(-)
MKSASEGISDSAGAANLADLQSSLSSQVDSISSMRNLVVLATLSAILGVLALQALVAACTRYGPQCCRPNGSCFVALLKFLLTTLNLLLILLTWIVAAILLATAIVSADYCDDSTNYLLNATNLDEQPVAVYYVCSSFLLLFALLSSSFLLCSFSPTRGYVWL